MARPETLIHGQEGRVNTGWPSPHLVQKVLDRTGEKNWKKLPDRNPGRKPGRNLQKAFRKSNSAQAGRNPGRNPRRNPGRNPVLLKCPNNKAELSSYLRTKVHTKVQYERRMIFICVTVFFVGAWRASGFICGI
jgi:hypothetical protein